jgi:hypothetical protein
MRSKSVSLSPGILNDELEKVLELVMSWQFGEWDELHGGYDSWKKNWTKDQFELLVNQYPLLDA